MSDDEVEPSAATEARQLLDTVRNRLRGGYALNDADVRLNHLRVATAHAYLRLAEVEAARDDPAGCGRLDEQVKRGLLTREEARQQAVDQAMKEGRW